MAMLAGLLPKPWLFCASAGYPVSKAGLAMGAGVSTAAVQESLRISQNQY